MTDRAVSFALGCVTMQVFTLLELFGSREPCPELQQNIAAAVPEAGADEGLERAGCLHPRFASVSALPMSRFRQALGACLPARVNASHLLVDPDGHPVISMTRRTCPLYFLAGASVIDGSAVEFGTWAGGSSRCIAAGVNLTGKEDRFFGFDAFQPGLNAANMKKMLALAAGNRFEAEIRRVRFAFDMRKMFLFNTQSVYPTTVAVRADFSRNLPQLQKHLGRRRLDLWTTDAAKTWAEVANQLNAVRSFLNVGALIILGDFFYVEHDTSRLPDQIPGVYHYLVPEFLEFLAFCPGNAHGFFGLKQHLPSLNPKLAPAATLGKEYWKAVHAKALADLSRVYSAGRLPNCTNQSFTQRQVDAIFADWV